MKFPELVDVTTSTATIDSFGGLNKRSVIGVGEFADCMNVSNDKSPCLSLRQKRAVLSRYTGDSKVKGCKALFYNEGLGYLCDSNNGDGTYGYIYYGSQKYMLPFTSVLDDVSVVNMGRRVVINNASPTWRKSELCVFDLNTKKVQVVNQNYTVSNITEMVSGGGGTFGYVTGGDFCHIRMLFEDGTYPSKCTNTYIDDNFQSHEECLNSIAKASHYNWLVKYGEGDNSVWLQILGDKTWQVVDRVIIRFCIPDVGNKFQIGDYINISGLGCYCYTTESTTDSYKKLYKGRDTAVQGLEGWYEIVNIKMNEDGYGWSIDVACDNVTVALANLLLIQSLSQYYDGTEIKDLTNDLYLADGSSFTRSAPALAYICESGNRIWGCGFDNQIYACELGNPYNWNRFEGTLMDSYAVSTGEDGDWTAAFNYLNAPVFFKEDMMYRVTGDDPSSFYVYEYTCRGVAKTCYNSLCVVNDTLYYQASDGIYKYNQSTPYCVSEKVHTASWRVGKAGRYKDKYIISVIDDNFSTETPGAYNHNRELYSFDTLRETWQKEDPIYAYDFASYDNTLYILESTATDDYTVYVLDEKVKYDEYEDRIAWYAETGVLTAGDMGRNYIRRIRVDAMLEAGSEMSVYIQYNGDGRWQKCRSLKEQKRNTLTIQIQPRRCDNVRLRFEGKGEFEIYSITMKYTKGSDKK